MFPGRYCIWSRWMTMVICEFGSLFCLLFTGLEPFQCLSTYGRFRRMKKWVDREYNNSVKFRRDGSVADSLWVYLFTRLCINAVPRRVPAANLTGSARRLNVRAATWSQCSLKASHDLRVRAIIDFDRHERGASRTKLPRPRRRPWSPPRRRRRTFLSVVL